MRYHGGKWRLAPWVISHFPTHGVYVEPFGGAASVLLHKAPTRIEVYNDVDEVILNLFRILRDPVRAQALRTAIELTPFSRGEHADCWVRSDDPIEDARRLIVRSFQSIGAKGSLSRTGWRTRTSKSVWSPCVSWVSWPAAIPAFVDRLKQVIIEALPWQRILDLYDSPETLWYVDPPYPRDTRDPDHRTIYARDLTNDNHAELCHRLRGVRGHVVLSGYDNPIYREILGDWPTSRTPSRAQNNAVREEVLWLSPSVAAGRQFALDFDGVAHD